LPRGAATPSAQAPIEDPRLNVGRKTVYATRDFTVSALLASLTCFHAQLEARGGVR
jgi:hypothetical protein